MEVSFCLGVTDLKEPLQLCYLQLQISNGSSQNNNCLIRNWKSPPPVWSSWCRGEWTCAHGHFVLSHSPCVCGQRAGGPKAVLGPGRPECARGKLNVHWALESGVPLLTCLVTLSKNLDPSWSQCPSLWTNPLGVFEICNDTLLWISTQV